MDPVSILSGWEPKRTQSAYWVAGNLKKRPSPERGKQGFPLKPLPAVRVWWPCSLFLLSLPPEWTKSLPVNWGCHQPRPWHETLTAKQIQPIRPHPADTPPHTGPAHPSGHLGGCHGYSWSISCISWLLLLSRRNLRIQDPGSLLGMYSGCPLGWCKYISW